MKKNKWLICAAIGAGMLFFSGCRTCGCPMATGEETPVEVGEFPLQGPVYGIFVSFPLPPWRQF